MPKYTIEKAEEDRQITPRQLIALLNRTGESNDVYNLTIQLINGDMWLLKKEIVEE